MLNALHQTPEQLRNSSKNIPKFLSSDLPSFQRNEHCERTTIVPFTLKYNNNKKNQNPTTTKKHGSPGMYFCSSGNQHALLYSSTFCMLSSLVYKVTSSTQLFLFFPVFSPKVTLNYFKTPSLQK